MSYINDEYKVHTTQDDYIVPDQRLFESDSELENKPISTWQYIRPYIVSMIGLSVISALFVTTGIYQALLLMPTPDHIHQAEIPARISGEVILLPVRVVLLVSDNSFGTQRDKTNVHNLIHKTDTIWNQALIDLTIENSEYITVSRFQEHIFRTDLRTFVRTHGYSIDGVITIFLTGTLFELNGVALGGIESIAVADITSHYDFRTLAHEIGHILGLDHVSNTSRLMSQGSLGVELTSEEIHVSRKNIRLFNR